MPMHRRPTGRPAVAATGGRSFRSLFVLFALCCSILVIAEPARVPLEPAPNGLSRPLRLTASTGASMPPWHTPPTRWTHKQAWRRREGLKRTQLHREESVQPVFSSSSAPLSSLPQRSALFDFFNSTGGPGWRNSSGWLSDSLSECVWFGVACDSSGLVVLLSLGSNGLQGILPASLSQLSGLQSLMLFDNPGLQGSTEVIGGLLSLHTVSLWSTSLSGPVPTWLCSLPLLRAVDLSKSRVSGAMVDCFQPCCTLSELILEHLHLSGPLPATLGNCVNLTVARFTDNGLTGPWPPEWQRWQQISEIDLSANPLDCELPSWIGGLAALRTLFLSNSGLTGSIPASIGQLADVEMIDLSINSRLGGSLPNELGQLGHLHTLLLTSCDLTGPLPLSLAGLPLSEFVIAGNRLTGNPWPALPRSLTYLSQSNNQFSGSIGDQLCALTHLRVLYSSGLSAVGPLPACIGALVSLEVLYLDHCDLTGALPSSLFTLPQLALLNLASNAFEGEIPVELSSAVSLQQLALSSNQLSGPLPILSALTQLVLVTVADNGLTGAVDLLSFPLSLSAFDLSTNQLSFPSIAVFAAAVRVAGTCIGPTFPLSSVSLAFNPVNLPAGDVLRFFACVAPQLFSLDVSAAGLFGAVVFDDVMLASASNPGDEVYGFPGLVSLTLAHNEISGQQTLGTLAGIGSILILDASDNDLQGTIPDQIAGVQRILLTHNENLRGAPTNQSAVHGYGPRYSLPAFTTADFTSNVRNDSMHRVCPSIVGAAGQELQVDPSYHGFQLCSCLPGYRLATDAAASVVGRCESSPSQLACDLRMYAPQHAVASGFYPVPLTLDEYARNSSLLLTDAVMIPCQSAMRCNPQSTTVYACAEGSDADSLLCSDCLPDYFAFDGRCEACATAAKWLSPLLLFIVAAVAVSLLLWMAIRTERQWIATIELGAADTPLSAPHERSMQPMPPPTLQPQSPVCEGSPSSSARDSSSADDSTLAAVVGSTVFWLQCHHALGSISGGAAPVDGMSSWLRWLSAAASFSPLGLECSSSAWNWQSLWWINVLAPIWLTVLVAAIFAVGYLWRCWPARVHRPQHALELQLPSSGDLDLSASLSVSSWRRVCIRLLLALFSFAYMNAATAILSSWHCEHVSWPLSVGRSGFSYLASAPSHKCGTAQHHSMIAVGVIVFSGFVIAAPVALVISATRTSRQRQAKGEQQGLTDRLLPAVSSLPALAADSLHLLVAAQFSSGLRFWRWQLMLVLRKLAIAGLVSLLPRTSAVTPLIIAMLLLAVMLAHTYWKPYRVHQQQTRPQPLSSSCFRVGVRRVFDCLLAFGSNLNLVESLLLLHLACLYLASVLSTAAREQQRLMAAGAVGQIQAGAVPTLLNPSGIDAVRESMEWAGALVVCVAIGAAIVRG